VTADCVPVLLGGGSRIAAVHAGWRGIAAGIVGAALTRLGVPGRELIAWLGPAIGACCYEVGDEVAREVAAASGSAVVADGPRGRPHLDLAAAVAAQLRRGGVEQLRTVDRCTRCDDGRLWSYRREGPEAGRNVAFVWLRP
jgi:YfiH family protein